LQLGDDARDAGKWGLAARHYREALRTLPNASAVWVQYGHAVKESGCLAEAEQAYRQSLKLNSDLADTHLQLGHALKLQGRRGEAERAYLRSAALDPPAPDACAELIAFGWTPERIAAAIEAPPPPVRAETLRPSAQTLRDRPLSTAATLHTK
jgi:Flp pilus assembly protein TadD